MHGSEIQHTRLEHALRFAVRRAVDEAPPRLARAIEHAVFPGGARLRPLLCALAAEAYGDPEPGLTTAAAVAVELMHCASLVHDDLPCFDDAPIRRGLPTVHARFDVPTAVLAGDALIVMAFDVLGRAESHAPSKSARLIRLVARAAGPSRGLVAGQAWELEPKAPLEQYQLAKTASLFEAAAKAGAISAGGPEEDWGTLGLRLGELYQIADDVADVTATTAGLGKPVGQDAAHGRPNVVRAYGLEEARRRLGGKLEQAIDAVPVAPHSADVASWLRAAFSRLLVPPPAESQEISCPETSLRIATRVG